MEPNKNKIEEKSVSTLLIEAKQGLDNACYFLDKKRPEPAKANLENVSTYLNLAIYSEFPLTRANKITIQKYLKINEEYSLQVIKLTTAHVPQNVFPTLTPGQAKRAMHKQFELNQSNYIEEN